MFQLRHKNITHIAHSCQKEITRKATLECTLSYDENRTPTLEHRYASKKRATRSEKRSRTSGIDARKKDMPRLHLVSTRVWTKWRDVVRLLRSGYLVRSPIRTETQDRSGHSVRRSSSVRTTRQRSSCNLTKRLLRHS